MIESKFFKKNQTAKFLSITILAIFLGESIIMVLINSLPQIPFYVQIFLDASLLVAITFPVTFILLYSPLFKEVNKRKIAEEKLQLSQTSFLNLVENNKNGILVVDFKNRIKFANTSSKNFFKFSTNDIEDETLSLSVVEDNNYEIEYSFNGELRTAEVVVSNTKWKNERALLLTVYDITERKQDELLLQKAYDDLKLMDEMKDDLIETISHELRTPLTSILGYSEALVDYEVDDKTLKKFAKNILDEAERLSILINNVLDVSTLSLGKLQLELEKTSVNQIIQRSLKSVSGILQVKENIQIEFNELSPDLFVSADEEKIVQVIVNLLSNAIKFAPINSLIEIMVQSLDESVTISIKDQGPGIPVESIDKIFDKFFRADFKNYAYEGSGLGLTIAKGIVDSHHGRIWAENHKNGAIFYVSISLFK